MCNYITLCEKIKLYSVSTIAQQVSMKLQAKVGTKSLQTIKNN